VLALARSRAGSGDMDRMRVKCASSTKASLICCRIDSSFPKLPGVCTNLERRAVTVPLKTAAQFRA